MSFSSVVQTTIAPHSQKPLVERTYPKQEEVSDAIQRAAKAQKEWKSVSLEERIKVAEKFAVGPLSISPDVILTMCYDEG